MRKSQKKSVIAGYTEEKRKEGIIMAVIHMDHGQFYSRMEEGELMLVDFWAPWCSYCRRIEPAYEKIAEQYGDKMAVAKVNIDDEPQLAEKERIEVIPTLVLYRGAEALGSIVAPESKAMIDDFIRQTLEKTGHE